MNEIEIEKICRTCLKKNVNMEKLFDNNYAFILTLNFGLQAFKNDGLPEQICSECVTQIKNTYSFKQQCQINDLILRKHIDKTLKENEQNNIPTNENKPENIPDQNETETNLLTCSECQKTFEDEEKFDLHSQIHKNESQICSICNKKCSTKSLLAKHMLRTHSKKTKNILNVELNDNNLDQKQCSQCGKSFPSRTDCLIHQRSHFASHQCHVCEETFTLPQSLTKHLKRHDAVRLISCPLCPRQFTTNYPLTLHMRTHTGERPFVCTLCGHGSSTKHNLKMHMRIHTGERPYKCNTCDQQFATKSQMNVHVKRHKGIKKNVCEVCGKAFVEQNELKLHQRYHNGERPYNCVICEKKFVTSKHLKIHIRTHTGEKPYSCDLCERSFAAAKTLREHRRIHCEFRPYICSKCGLSFTQLNTLKTHEKTHLEVREIAKESKTEAEKKVEIVKNEREKERREERMEEDGVIEKD